MDSVKIGKLIAQLRKEKGLTQKNVADALQISNKTVSKWECGLGCPDLSLWPELSTILNADIVQMMEGEIAFNRPNSGNIDKARFYVCPACGNTLVSTGSASVFCCGKKLEPAPVSGELAPAHIVVEEIDMDYYITFDHPMDKEHYLVFAAYVKNDRVILTQLYPEQSAALRLPPVFGGKLYVYCSIHGLLRCGVDL